MEPNPYLVQCLYDHIYEVVAGTELEQRCKDRETRGLIDALCLGPDECPDCVEDTRAQERKWDEINSGFGCGFADFDGNCTDDCPCKADPTPESPLSRQVRGLPLTSHT